MIFVSPTLERQMQDHAQATYPEECGGLLLGHNDSRGRIVVEVLRLKNNSSKSRHRRVEVDPLDYLRAERRAAAKGLGVCGFYHSHPDHPACPSRFDLEQATATTWSYLIVPVSQGQVGPVRSWILSQGGRHFVEEVLIHS